MEYILNNVKVRLPYNEDSLQKVVDYKLGFHCEVKRIVKQSIDARKKAEICYLFSVLVDMPQYKANSKEFLTSPRYKAVAKDLVEYKAPVDPLIPQDMSSEFSPVVIGFGPAGIFAGLILATAGLKPIIIERGKRVNDRVKDIAEFLNNGILNTESNIQYGEGGAGTFSDGKLNSLISSGYRHYVLEQFVKFGANEDIMYSNKPHIGTDILRKVIVNIRKHILELGGQIMFEHKFVDYVLNGSDELVGIQVEHKNVTSVITTNNVVLAIGHSARDTFEVLYNKGLVIEPKSFAMGVRIEHLASMIYTAQYGTKYKDLPTADYKLSCHLPSGRSVFTFCMCPGGEVVASASEEGGIVTNGMSYNARDGVNSNSGVMVNVNPEDYEGTDVLAGVRFQQKYERLAYNLTGGYGAPYMRAADFLGKNKGSVDNKSYKIQPTYANAVSADITKCLPEFVTQAIREAMPIFDKKLNGFSNDNAILTAVESRSSSPIRMIRDGEFNSSVKGIYPCGEGSGYAGGIMSAAIDGMKVALAIIDELIKQ